MKTIKIILLLILLMALNNNRLCAQINDYFPLKEGNFWIYILSTGAMIRNEVIEKENIDGKELLVLATSAVGSNKIQQKEYYSIEDDSLMLYGRVYDNLRAFYQPCQKILDPSLKAGTSWLWQGKIEGQAASVNFQVEEPENITIKKNNFMCYKVTSKIKEQSPAGVTVTITRWYAKGVGLVKEEDKLEGDGKTDTISSEIDYYKVFP